MATLEQAIADSPVGRASAPCIDNPDESIIAGPIYLAIYRRPRTSNPTSSTSADDLAESYRACIFHFSGSGVSVRDWPVGDVAWLTKAFDAWSPVHDESAERSEVTL